MPSPGQSAIATILGSKTYTVEGGFSTAFKKENPFVQKLAAAMHVGWTSASPTMPTSMVSAFNSELNGFLAGQGLQFITCIATGIDQETATWAANWDSQAQVHTYVVNAASIVSRVQSCAPLWSNGARAIAEAAADAFMSGFGQETG